MTEQPASTMNSIWSCHSAISGAPVELRYDDALGLRYEYDSNVVNHNRVSAGDVLVIRDGQLIYGYGVVRRVESHLGPKTMSRCPVCRSSDISLRKRLLPAFRCNDCAATFDEPFRDEKTVRHYSASYDGRWFEFASPIPVRALEGVYAGRDRQNAIRRLEPAAAHALLQSHADIEGYLQLAVLAHRDQIDGGHVEALVRRRVGQQQFRDRLFERFGPTCAFTGPQPEPVLDAAHLYSFAERPVHEDDGGLLLRADLHRMFDRLLITFDPHTWRSVVAPPVIRHHEHLRSLDGVEIAIPGPLRPRTELIREHCALARKGWRDLE